MLAPQNTISSTKKPTLLRLKRISVPPQVASELLGSQTARSLISCSTEHTTPSSSSSSNKSPNSRFSFIIRTNTRPTFNDQVKSATSIQASPSKNPINSSISANKPPLRSPVRISRIWTQPTKLKLHGLLEHYKEAWFDIHCSTLLPLFSDVFLISQAQSLNDLNCVGRAQRDQEQILQPQIISESKSRSFQIRVLAIRHKKTNSELVKKYFELSSMA